MLDRYCSPMKILLVEDNPADVCLVEEALKDAKVFNEFNVVSDGVEALQFLRREGDYFNAPRPDIILLDLNLPRKNGREVLEEVKSDPELRQIPVIVLTSSEADEDISNVYNLHANCFITKPPDLESFIRIMGTIEEFWFTMVKLPRPMMQET